MRVLVTGAAGYVGTSLIPQLLQAGYKVRAFDNLIHGGDQLLPFFRHDNFEFIKGDICDASSVKSVVKDCDAVIHLAAIVGYAACRANPQLAQSVNVDGAKNIASAISRNQLILFGSTGSNYGAMENVCTEETPLQPLSIYGRTKTDAERHLMEECSCIAYRFATAFGLSPRLRLDLLVNDFTYKAVSQQYLVVYESFFMRTFIHVYDMGRAFLFALAHSKEMIGKAYNIGSNKMNYSKRQVCELIESQTKCYVHYAEVGQDADKRNYFVSYEKINKFGFDTTITLQHGISELIRGFSVLNFKTPYANA